MCSYDGIDIGWSACKDMLTAGRPDLQAATQESGLTHNICSRLANRGSVEGPGLKKNWRNV